MNKRWYTTAWTTGTLTALLTLSACGSTPPATQSKETPGASGTPGTKTISLSVITSNRYLETAKANFEAKHPDIKIDIKETIAAPKTDGKQMVNIGGPKDTQSQEKYLSTVSTELMSGKASDLILVDQLPYKKYVDKKLLDNWNDWIKKDTSFDRSQYFTNVFDALIYKDGLYTLPIKASLNMLLGNQELLAGAAIDDTKWTWKDFKAIADTKIQDVNKDGVPDGPAIGNLTDSDLLGLLLDSSYTQFVDAGAKKASFTGKPFLDMLELAKSMPKGPSGASRDAALFQSISPRQYEDMYFLTQTSFNGNGVYYNLPTEKEKKGLSFTSDLMLAMNSKSKYKAEAWEFVKYLLSEEMQVSRDLAGFAVHKNANKKRSEELGVSKPGQQIKLMGKDGKEIVPKPPEPKDLARIEAYMSSVQTFAETDPKVRKIVLEESAPFFSGQKTAEETAKVIQNKVSTYLQE
ncbi:extracellular solute-binding protein [Paenibacillus sp. HJGM_3]|uniref:ABC transporter substrate-binding protein n=1 Tax=Paenibacillus sp. HJGM_3 TaxID=3379816 RepID=UPI0038597894